MGIIMIPDVPVITEMWHQNKAKQNQNDISLIVWAR